MKFRNIKTGEISEPFFEGEYAYWNDICGIGSRQMLINEFNSLFEPINKLTCRGCNKELDSCTCNVLTTGKTTESDASIIKIIELVDELEQQDIRIKDLERINESHRIENGELRERIKKLEETALTKDEAIKVKDYLIRTHKPSTYNTHNIFNKCTLCNFIAKLQKIIDKRG